MADLEKVKEMFPVLAGFLGNPEMAALLQRATDEGWPANKLQAQVEATNYWKNTTANSRQMDILRLTDPATYNQTWNSRWAHMVDIRKKLGVKMSDAEFRWFTTQAIQNGWSDDTVTDTFLGVHQSGGVGKIAGGDLGAAMTQVRAVADEYGVTASSGHVFKQARLLLNGGADAAGIADEYRGKAQSMYSHNKQLVDALGRGVTVKQYADPYLQLAQQELGVPPGQQRLSDPKWNAFLTSTDPKTGQGMTLDQWRAKLRTDQTYGYNQTSGASDQASQLTSALAKEFGASG